ncbi:MAG: gamma-glutamylcyclotransferase family protein [Nitriliruptorales bacterium]|nr:gamma-glutamylcyclotransferase family protein [Nitriliruptorales bacterium]
MCPRISCAPRSGEEEIVSGAYYFAYGSNLSAEQMRRRCPAAVALGVARLADHRLAFTRWSPVWRGGVADVVPSAGAAVWGLLWQLTDEDLQALDGHEGHPVNYRRSLHTVEATGLGPHDAWVYEVVDKRSFVPPASAYLEILLESAALLGLPAAHLAEVRTAADPADSA